MIPIVERSVDLLREYGVGKSKFYSYMLVTDDISDAEERAEALRGMGVDVFAQPFRGINGKTPDKMAEEFARWVNVKAMFKTKTFAEFLEIRGYSIDAHA